MYAVIKTGGKQYKVAPGDVIQVEHLKVKSEASQVTLTPLLVVTDDGKTVSASDELSRFPVAAKVLGDTKGPKITVFKYRNKTGYASKNGHRQLLSLVQITSIGDAEAAETKTVEDVLPESSGPQKPAPEKKEEPVVDTPEDSSPGEDSMEPAEEEQGGHA